MFKKLLTEQEEHYCWEEFVEARRTSIDLARELGVSRDTVQRAIKNTQQRELRHNRENRHGKRNL